MRARLNRLRGKRNPKGVLLGPDLPSSSGGQVFATFPDGSDIDQQGNDLAQLGALIFAVEGLIRTGRVSSLENYELRISELSPKAKPEVEEVVSALLTMCVGTSPSVKIIDRPKQSLKPAQLVKEIPNPVLLFSGGTDSLAGLALCERTGVSAIPVFVAHGNGSTGLVNRLHRGPMKGRLAGLCSVQVQKRGGLQQTRGFLYVLLASILARARGAHKVVVSESGPTMFLPQFCPLDDVTLTTNPIVMALTTELVSQYLGWKPEISTPFSNLTKAESVAWIGKDSALAETNSCVRTQFASYKAAPHCGECFGCLVRQVSFMVAGTAPSRQVYDPLFSTSVTRMARRLVPGTSVSKEKEADTIAVLEFCVDILTGQLTQRAKNHILRFGKTNLFRRFALDFLTALHIGYRHGGNGTNLSIKRFYEECLDRDLVSEEIATSRIEDVRSRGHVPNLDLTTLRSLP